MAERTTVRLPEELVRRAKRHAAAKGTTMTALIEEGLRRVLKERDMSTKNVGALPRISQAGRDQPATVGLADLAALQEQDDIEYVARMKRVLNDTP